MLYFGLIDKKVSPSDKDLPVHPSKCQIKLEAEFVCEFFLKV